MSFLDALFVGVSASTCTGLVSVDISKWGKGALIVTLLQTELGGVCLSTCLAVAFLRHRRARWLGNRRKKNYESWEDIASDIDTPNSSASDAVFDPEANVTSPVTHYSRKPLLAGTAKSVQRSVAKNTTMGLSIDYDMEARATGWLAVIFVLYSVFMQLLGFLVLGAYVHFVDTPRKIIESRGQSTWWWALFHTIAAFNNTGMSTLSDGLEMFSQDPVILCVLCSLVAVGNTCLPIVVRFVIWMARNLSGQRRLPKSLQSLRYILVNPTRCHTHIFPGVHTRLLVCIFLVLNIVSTLAYVALEGKNPLAWQTWLFGGFLAVATRTAGFSITDLSKLSEPLLLLILGSMYIAAYPIALVRQYREEQLEEALGQKRPATKFETMANNLKGMFFHHLIWLYIAMFCMSLFEYSSKDILRTSLLRIAFELLWDAVVAVLSRDIGDPAALCAAVADLHGLSHPTRHSGGNGAPAPLPGLLTAVSELGTAIEGFDFFATLLPCVVSWAKMMPSLFPGDAARIPALLAGLQRSVSYTREQARSVLALAFFCAMPDYPGKGTIGEFGSISMWEVYSSRSSVAVERIKCLLAYLHCARSWRQEAGEVGRITFERRVLPEAPVWKTSKAPLCEIRFSAEHRIEDVPGADMHVDFANADLHIGRIQATATQEEVLFSIRPELFLGLLASETMMPNEAIVMSGTRRCSRYTGYQGTFRFAGIHPEALPAEARMEDLQRIVAIDAVIAFMGISQFSQQAVDRDIHKAYVGFLGYRAISTGAWGCGAFGGDRELKMLQQAIAASVAAVPVLYFSTFGKSDDAIHLDKMYKEVMSKAPDAGALYRALVGAKPGGHASFGKVVLRRL
eukprot:m51a1_g3744 hypothetical protein (851) ;mRNA; f:61658-64904